MESRKGRKDYYAVLGVEPDWDATAIKKAYRALAQKYHPDRLKDRNELTNASERMIEINEAFAVLADTKRRADFDREITALKTPPKPAQADASEEEWDLSSIAPK